MSILEKSTMNIEVNNIESLLKTTKHGFQKKHREYLVREKIQEIIVYLSSIGTFSDLNAKQLQSGA